MKKFLRIISELVLLKDSAINNSPVYREQFQGKLFKQRANGIGIKMRLIRSKN